VQVRGGFRSLLERHAARQAVLDVIRELLNLGKQKPDPKVKVDPRAALAGIGVVRRALDDIDSETATTYVNTVYRRPEGGRIPIGLGQEANGGIHVNGVKAFADGGYGMDGRYYQRVPQIVKGGANILWGEEATGREAYISAKAGMEARNVEILSQAASWFGMGFHRMAADGAVTGRGAGGVERVVERGGPTVVKVHDVDNQLIGSMRGEITDDQSYRGTLGRMGVHQGVCADVDYQLLHEPRRSTGGL
jgi:hypothetical protein